MTSTFKELGVLPELITALEKQSITEPTPIQTAAIPLLLEKKDAYLQAETGTGKTLAYLLPLFSRIDTGVSNAQVIVVAPTHELALQIQRQCTDLSQFSGLPVRVLLLIGGTSRDRQLEKLKKKPHIVIGSTGRIRELIEAGKLKARNVHTVVVDEADRMLASEGVTDLKAIIDSTASDRSVVFASATEHPQSSGAIASLSSNLTRIKTGAAPVNPNIEHLYLVCEARDKPDFVRKLIHAMGPDRAMIFVHKSESAELLANKLEHHKLRVADIHGSLNREDRKKAMQGIRNGTVDILIASDIAARGLDIKGVTHVINFDVPTDSGAYLHRVGRTGRAGEKGIAISLMSGPEIRLVERYKKDLGISLTEVYLREGAVYAAQRPEHAENG